MTTWLDHCFARIHAFANGNGHATRVLNIWHLVRHGYLPITVTRDDGNDYIDALDPLVHFTARLYRPSAMQTCPTVQTRVEGRSTISSCRCSYARTAHPRRNATSHHCSLFEPLPTTAPAKAVKGSADDGPKRNRTKMPADPEPMQATPPGDSSFARLPTLNHPDPCIALLPALLF